MVDFYYKFQQRPLYSHFALNMETKFLQNICNKAYMYTV
jgi:hypothetical protein